MAAVLSKPWRQIRSAWSKSSEGNSVPLALGLEKLVAAGYAARTIRLVI
jgi:hypothetical protein